MTPALFAHEALFEHRYGVFQGDGCIVVFDNNFVPSRVLSVRREIRSELARLGLKDVDVSTHGPAETPNYTMAWAIPTRRKRKSKLWAELQAMADRVFRISCGLPMLPGQAIESERSSVWDRLLLEEAV